jgi:hypothetical protein
VREIVTTNWSLPLIIAGPIVWSVHFMLCYVTVSIWCAKVVGPAGSLGGARTAIAIFTAVALSAVAFTAIVGRRAWRTGHGGGHEDSPEDRQRFVGVATLLLSGLSGLGIVYSALPAVFVESCL